MKNLFFVLFLITGCSTTTRFYHAADVVHELKNNSQQLTYVAAKVKSDFEDKELFFEKYSNHRTKNNTFILEDLAYRLKDLKQKRDKIVANSMFIKKANDSLLNKVSIMQKISENDPVYQDIEDFSVITHRDAKKLYEDFETYKTSSNEFVSVAMFTRNTLKQSTRVE